MNTATSKVLDFSLVQVTEVKNSNAMKLEGLKRCLDHLQQEQVASAKLATDRHVQVRAHMKKERPSVWNDGNPSFTTRLISTTGTDVSISTSAQPTHPKGNREKEVGSPAHDALKEVALNKSLLKDIGMLTEFINVPWPHGKEVLPKGAALLI